MARSLTWGTPGRSDKYFFPRSPLTVFFYSLAAGAIVLGVYIALGTTGFRAALSPGDVASAHAPIEKRCQECHAGTKGVADGRCQRCHDPAGGGRKDTKAHALFGGGDAATRVENVPCAHCHVEHRGRARALDSVDPAHCSQCHFRRFTSHPEFSALRVESIEDPGIRFGHQRHVEEVLKTASSNNPIESCNGCHDYVGPDFAPLSFDRHCAGCHLRDGSVGEMDFVAAEDVATSAGLEERRGRVRKTTLAHRDPWLLSSVRTLAAEVEPEAYAAARGALAARLGALTRRRALATPLAGLNREALQARERALTRELEVIDARLSAAAAAAPSAHLPVGGGAPTANSRDSNRPDRISEIEAFLDGAPSPALDAVIAIKASLASARQGPLPRGPLGEDALEARRRELLSLLEAVEARAPETKSLMEDLRRRVLALVPGEESREVLGRARDERAASLERVRDELRLRESGTSPSPNVLLQRDTRRITAAMQELASELRDWPAAPPPPLTADAAERKTESLEILLAPCVKCHVRGTSPRFDVHGAEPVLVRASFTHGTHLLPSEGNCLKCHPNVVAASEAAPLNFLGIESCRECHRAQGSRTDCELCHSYHPPPLP